MPFRPDSPVELPDGRLVCGTHGRVVCGICCVDYTFMDDVLDLGSDLDGDGEALSEFDISTDDRVTRDGSAGRIDRQNSVFTIAQALSSFIGTTAPDIPRAIVRAPMPTRFTPSASSNTDPRQLFPDGRTSSGFARFVNQHDPSQILIYTDGACLDNGCPGARAGSAFVYRSAVPGANGYVQFRLENKGPSDKPHLQTSNRAELRAVLGVLQFRYWPGEGVSSLVIATDSEYVVNGATEWVQRWQRNGWRTARGAVRNKDLWMALWEEFERWADGGLRILFWRIPRELNTEADRWARVGATEEECFEFGKIMGAGV